MLPRHYRMLFLKGKNIISLLPGIYPYIIVCLALYPIWADLILVTEISDWQTGATGPLQPHPSVCRSLQWAFVGNRANRESRQSCVDETGPQSPNQLLSHPWRFSDPTVKQWSAEETGKECFSLSGELFWGLERRLGKYYRWMDKSFKNKCYILEN